MKDFISMIGQYKMVRRLFILFILIFMRRCRWFTPLLLPSNQNSLGQSFGGKLLGNSSATGQQYAGLGTMGTGYGQTTGGAMGGGLGAMMGNILHGNEHGGKKHKEKAKKKKK